MSYASQAARRYGATPFELFWFTMAPALAGVPPQDWRYTSGDTGRTHLGKTYEVFRVTRSEIQQDNELSSGQITVTVPSDGELAAQFLRGAPIAPISLTIYAGHDGDDEVLVAFSGVCKTAKFSGPECSLTVVPDHQSVRKHVPSLAYMHPCAHILYSPGCGVPLAGFSPGIPMQWTGNVATIDAADARKVTIAASGNAFASYWLGEPSGPTCTWGFVVLPSGRAIMIDSHASGSLTIRLKTGDSEIAPGVQITIQRGCGRTQADCKAIHGLTRKIPFLGFDAISSNPFMGLY